MALKLQSFKFVCVNHQFIYPKGTKEEDRPNVTPDYVKISGIATSNGKDLQTCYLMDKFSEFGKSKDQLSSALNSNIVILGNGILKLDNSFNYRLDLDAYNFGSYYWHLNIDTHNDSK